MEKLSVAIKDKVTLTIEEASAYSNIGTKRLYEITSDPLCPFVLKVGSKKLIKRERFEKFLINKNEI